MESNPFRLYVINFQVSSDHDRNLVISDFVRFHPFVYGYWNYIPLVYCIKSNKTASEIRAALENALPGGGYLVAEVNPQNIDGMLPKAAWEWFYTPPQPSAVNLPPPTPSKPLLGLGGLFHAPPGRIDKP